MHHNVKISVTDPHGAPAPLRMVTLALSIAAAMGALPMIAAADEPCEPQWDNTIGQPGMDNPTILALTVYDGDLIAGGGFTTAGGQTVNRIARWDGSSWHPLQSGGQVGANSWVNALTVYNGDLIAGGDFTTAGGQTVNRIARWDGSAWHPLISGGEIGVSSPVRALTVYNGDLIAAGDFTIAGGQTVNYIARWDGSSWHPLDSGGQIGVSGLLRALTVYDGDLIAGGYAAEAGAQPVNNIARWDGFAWHPLNSGNEIGVSGGVYALTSYAGDLIAGGQFNTAGGQTVNSIARWDGSSWHPLISGGQVGVAGSSLPTVHALTVSPTDLFAAGMFSWAGGQIVNHVARWDGSMWHALSSGGQSGVGADSVRALEVYNSGVVVGGSFTTAGGQVTNHIASWSGIGDLPSVQRHPADAVGDLDQTVIISISASGDLLSYQWRKNGDPLTDTDHITGSDIDTLTFNPVRVSDTGTYDVVASNPCGSVVSEPAMLTVIFTPEPEEQTVYVGNATVFSVDLVEGNTVDYQWRHDGEPLASGPNIVGAQSPTLVILSPTLNHADEYDVVVSGDFGEAISEPAMLTVCKLGDINCDGVVNVDDLLILLAAWGECDDPADCPADLTGDGSVAVDDLLILLANWG